MSLLFLFIFTVGLSQESRAETTSHEERQRQAIAILWCQAPNDGMLHFFDNQSQCRREIAPILEQCWQRVKRNNSERTPLAKRLTDCTRARLNRRRQ